MIPDDFVELAIKLSANPSEAAQRSAVSRAYYGAFHACKLLIESCGFQFASSAETHVQLPYCLQHSGDSELSTAGQKLISLRVQRNRADYDLEDRNVAHLRKVQILLTTAREVLDIVASAARRLPAFRQAVRDYARNVLGKFLTANE